MDVSSCTTGNQGKSCLAFSSPGCRRSGGRMRLLGQERGLQARQNSRQSEYWAAQATAGAVNRAGHLATPRMLPSPSQTSVPPPTCRGHQGQQA